MILVPQETIDAYTARGWWGDVTLHGLLARHARERPHEEAVVDAPNRAEFTGGAPRRLTWAMLDAEVTLLCRVLLAQGLRKDDVLALQMPNCVEQFVVYLACARLGIVVTPMPIQYREHEISHVLATTGAKAAVTCRRIGRHAHAGMFEALRAAHPRLRGVYAFGGEDAGSPSPLPSPASGRGSPTDDAAGPLPAGVIALEPLLRAAGAVAGSENGDALAAYLAATTVTANDVFTICWTSGTEASPKGVPRSHNEWLVFAPSVIAGAGLSPGCRMLCPFPLVNMAGLSAGFAAWLALGGTVVQHHPFTLAVYLRQLREERIGYTIAAPAILGQLLHEPALAEGIDFSRLPAIGSGSAPLSEWLVRGFKERFGVDIVNHFGSNEGASLTGGPQDVPSPAERARFFPRAGVDGFTWHTPTAAKVRTRLVDPETGAEVRAAGRPGELRVKGATVFSGYYNAPELTAHAFDDQGYYRTGDLFEIGGERGQYYRYAGRSKDVVIRGGMNISSEEVENLLLAHPRVREAAIVGYADEAMGERVCACVVAREGDDASASTPLTLGELTRFLREDKRVAVYKLPERLVLLDALPRNPVGKVLKRSLREQVARMNAPTDTPLDRPVDARMNAPSPA